MLTVEKTQVDVWCAKSSLFSLLSSSFVWKHESCESCVPSLNGKQREWKKNHREIIVSLTNQDSKG